jgi:hypothetical protein
VTQRLLEEGSDNRFATIAKTASERPAERRRAAQGVEQLIERKTREVGVTSGHRPIGGSGLGGELEASSASQLGRQCIDDALELARGGHLRHLAQTGDDPAPGLAVLVAERLGQCEIAVRPLDMK